MGIRNFLIKMYYSRVKDPNLYKRKDIKPINTDASKPTSVLIGIVNRIGLRFGDIGSKDFEDPEYNFNDVDSAYDTDSYIRQGVDKLIDQVFKEGYGFYGKNPNSVEYIKLRLKYMAQATGVSTHELFQDITGSVVKYNNCVLVKARMSDASQLPPGVTVTGINGLEPVVGYFAQHPGTLKTKRDKNGTIQGWQQEVEGSDKAVKFKAEDVVHFYYKKKLGNAFATPFLVPVLDDVRALRFAEENVVNMVYKHINPFYHIKIGTVEFPGADPEVKKMEQQLSNMTPDAGLVTTERVEIKAVESNKVIDAKPYLEHLEKRVFTGIGISEVDFGRGDTANRNTADSMTDSMSDRIKAIQAAIEITFTDKIIKELLLEGGFDPILNPDDAVTFEFIENDIDRKIKNENAAVFLYEHNAITEDEMREQIGKDPIADVAKMHLNVITIPTIQAQASAKASNSTSGTTQNGSKQANNKNQPQNQYGTKTSPKKTTNAIDDYTYLLRFSDGDNDLDRYINVKNDNTDAVLKHLRNVIKDDMSNKYVSLENVSEYRDFIVNRYHEIIDILNKG
jgi:hypothetical protein